MRTKTPIADDFEGRKRWIFEQCGHKSGAAELPKLGIDDWQAINSELNRAYKLGLDAPTIQTLALLDTVLHGTHRFFKMAHIRAHTADSTAAHSKQTMNLVQDMFDTAYPKGTSGDTETLRREAVLGAGLHDLGELIVEGTTMDYMNKLNGDERKETENLKDKVEEAVTKFAIVYASKCVAEGNPQKFLDTIDEIKQKVGLIDKEKTPLKVDKPIERFPDILKWIEKKGAKRIGDYTPPPAIQDLLHIYEQVESKDSAGMLRPVVKCVERLEGVRYLQHNSSVAGNVPLDLATSFQVVTTCERAEKGLPEMFEIAAKEGQLPLARAVADRAYESIVRGFMGDESKGIKRFPKLINIHTDHSNLSIPHVEPDVGAALYQSTGKRLDAAREATSLSRRATGIILHEHQIEHALAPDSVVSHVTRAPVQFGGIINRDQAAKYYEAARIALNDADDPFTPETLKKGDGRRQTMLTLISENQVPETVTKHIADATKQLRLKADTNAQSAIGGRA